MPSPPQHLQRALQLHPAVSPAALLPLAQRRPRRLLPAGPRRILHQLHRGRAPQAGRAAPQDGCGCGRGAQLPRAPCSRPDAHQSPERGSNPSGQLPSPCLPLCLRGAGNSPLPSQPWELMSRTSGPRVRGTGQSGDRAEQVEESGHPWGWSGSRGTGGGWARGSGCLHLPQGRELWEKGPRCCWGPDPAWAKPLPWHPRVGAGREHRGCQAGGRWEPQVLAGSHCLIPACPVPARSLWTPQEGGGHPRPRAVLRSLGVSLAEAAAARLEAPGAPTLLPPGRYGLMVSRCGHSPAKGPTVPWSGGCRCLGRVGRFCQDVCRGARSPARSSFCSREAPSELHFIMLRFMLCASRGRAVKGAALGSCSALGQR